jgi:hypothetical protein
MHDRARNHPERPLNVQLELHLDRVPVSGWLRTQQGRDEEFVGWLGFVEALRRLSEAQTDERS